MSKRDALRYEVYGSLWANWISVEWMQNLAAKYFSWKVRRKFKRYEQRWPGRYYDRDPDS